MSYGKLYNWFFVSSGNLCPPGWHVPSDSEWSVLLGNNRKIDGLLGGIRESNGLFTNEGSFGYWWSSTSTDSNNAWVRDQGKVLLNSGRYIRNKADGLSCRCVKD